MSIFNTCAKRFLCLAALIASYNAVPLAVYADQPVAEKSASATAQAKAQITLMPSTQCRAYELRLEKSKFSMQMPGYLISIDHKDLRNLTRKQLEELLTGTSGSSVDFEVMSQDGTVKTDTAIRQSVTGTPVWPRDLRILSSFDSCNGHWNGAFVEDSLDILSRATQNIVLREANDWPEDKALCLSSAAFPATIDNYLLGNVSTADTLLDLCITNSKSGQRWLPAQNHQIGQAIRTLIAAGRIDGAKKIMDVIFDGNMQALQFDTATIESLVNAIAKTDKSAAMQEIENYRKATGKRRGSLLSGSSEQWICEFYMRIGEYQKAQDEYEALLKTTANYGGKKAWNWVLNKASSQYQIAYAQHSLGKKDLAVETLTKAAKNLKEDINEETLSTIEKMPGAFPKLSDINSALADVQKNQSPQNNPILADNKQSDPAAATFAKIRACHTAIKGKNKTDAVRIIQSLLNDYPGNLPTGLQATAKLNAYCAILTLAREMANAAWLDDSNRILQALHKKAVGKDANEVAEYFLKAELFYNKTKARGKGNSKGQQIASSVDQFPETRSTSNAVPIWENLRRTAMAFYFADELERAEVYINSAIRASDRIARSQQNDSFALMSLEAACIAAKRGQYAKADSLWKQLMQNQQVCSDNFRQTAIELCTTYINNQKRPQAIAMLTELQARPSEMTILQVGNGVTAVDLMLAKNLLNSGNVNEASKIATATAAAMPKRLTWNQCLIVAQCAEAAKDYATAAEYYEMKRWTSGLMPFMTEQGYDDSALKAYKLAKQTSNMDKDLFVKICTEYGDSLRNKNDQEAYRIYKEAFDATPESSPQKIALLNTLAQLERAKAQFNQIKQTANTSKESKSKK